MQTKLVEDITRKRSLRLQPMSNYGNLFSIYTRGCRTAPKCAGADLSRARTTVVPNDSATKRPIDVIRHAAMPRARAYVELCRTSSRKSYVYNRGGIVCADA